MLELVWQDLRYAIRQLKQNPGFAVVAVLSLALGIGANTAIFQLIDAIRLRVLPVRDPQELVTIQFREGSARSGWYTSRSARLTYALWDRIRSQQQSFQGVTAWSAARFNLANGGEARYVEGLYVSGDFFQVLGVSPILGRTISSEDDSESCSSPGAVIGYSFWQQEFGGDPGVLGRTVSLDGHPFPVIGVTPASFFGVEVGYRYSVAIPLCADRLMAEDKKGRIPLRHAWWLSMVGRLKPGWTVTRAKAHLEALSPGIMEQTLPQIYKPDMVKRYLADKLDATEGATGVSELRRDAERPLWLLMATTGLVLLIACANLANLLLARASVRERETAVRLAIGASRWALVRQLLAESLLLAFCGAALGAGLAQALSRGLIAFMTTADNPVFLGVGLDWRMLGFTGALAVATCLLFGLMPAIRATSVAPAVALRSAGRSMSAGRERFSMRRALVATQVAFSLVLLVGALLFARTLHNLVTTEAGFRPEGVLTVNVNFKGAQYPTQRRQAVYRELQEQLAACPGVISAAQVWFTPVSGAGWDSDIGPEGTTAAASGKLTFFNRVGPGYFRTMGAGLIAGREFDQHDTLAAPKVAIVNELFARKFFGSLNVVGHTFRMEAEAGKPEPLFQIVGVVRNMKYYELREDFRPLAFYPVAQEEDPGPEATFVLRVQGSPSDLMQAVKTRLAKVSPLIGLQLGSFSTQLRESLLLERFMATLSVGFALLAGSLAMLGLYGVIAYMVARRQNEIGIRIALGADRGRVILLVLRETAILLGVGMAAGVALALWAGRAAATMLYGVPPYDAVSIASALALLGATALAASYVPALRAAALEPMAALRVE